MAPFSNLAGLIHSSCPGGQSVLYAYEQRNDHKRTKFINIVRNKKMI